MESNGKLLWTIIRTILFLVMGLANTVFIDPEDAGSYKEYLGYFFLFLVAAEIFGFVKKMISGDTKTEEDNEENEKSE